ncbi:MAG: DUF4124 domain-containing protein [Sideroxyarcus sp.]|nr:DUF4124 domain-containing protein [Sideroxyarcus sp.]
MKFIRLSVLSCALAFIGTAQAEIYKRVDADGHVTYSSVPIKGARKLQLEPLPTMVPPKARNNSSEFPRVDGETQTRRDDTRRKILEDELATEQMALDEARAKLKEAEDTPEVHKGVNGQTFRNVAKYEEKVNAAQDDVKTHEENIQALKTELSNLK